LIIAPGKVESYVLNVEGLRRKAVVAEPNPELNRRGTERTEKAEDDLT
jgi:hypothetical protein